MKITKKRLRQLIREFAPDEIKSPSIDINRLLGRGLEPSDEKSFDKSIGVFLYREMFRRDFEPESDANYNYYVFEKSLHPDVFCSFRKGHADREVDNYLAFVVGYSSGIADDTLEKYYDRILFKISQYYKDRYDKVDVYFKDLELNCSFEEPVEDRNDVRLIDVYASEGIEHWITLDLS